MRVSRDAVGTDIQRTFQDVLMAAQGRGNGRTPRGGGQVGAVPTDGNSLLPGEWADDVAYASHVVYHYGTPIAWVDARHGFWVVPDVKYSAQTSGVQNRIREYLKDSGTAYRS